MEIIPVIYPNYTECVRTYISVNPMFMNKDEHHVFQHKSYFSCELITL